MMSPTQQDILQFKNYIQPLVKNFQNYNLNRYGNGYNIRIPTLYTTKLENDSPDEKLYPKV